jgi:hypothetical protein
VKPKLFVGMPHAGLATPDAVQALYTPASPSILGGPPVVCKSANSIATAGFNDLLAIALNLRDEGRVTHFAMIHSDICPGVAWVDTLWREMQAHSLDLISAVVAVKDPGDDPPLSTCVGPVDDPWGGRRRLRRSELFGLPPTFTAVEAGARDGECLLVNTGLWLADLRHPAWDDFPGFVCDSRIVRLEDGTRASVVDSEDWAMSRWAARNGLKVGATQALGVEHAGNARWANRP